MTNISISGGLESSILDIDSIVDVKVEVDFTNTFTWVEIPHAYVEQVSYNEKLSTKEGFGIVNTFSVIFNNKHKWFTDTRFGSYSTNFTSPTTVNLNGVQQADGFGNLRPGRRIRIIITVGEGNEWIQRCYGNVDLNGFKEVIKEANDNVVTINCVDPAKMMIDEPMMDEEERYSCYIGKKYSDPNDTINSLIHLIGSQVNLHHWFDSIDVSGTTVTCSSTAGLSPGMAVSGTGITGSNYVSSITDSTHFELTSSASTGTYTDWEATKIYAQTISLTCDYAPLVESAWKELSLLAQALLATLTMDEYGWLYFGDSRYGDSWVEPTTEEDTIDNDFYNSIQKSPVFGEIKNVIKIEWDKAEEQPNQYLFHVSDNYNQESKRCNIVIPGKLTAIVQAGSDTENIKLDAAHQEADDYYNGYEIEIDSEVREILDYVNSTNTAVVKALTAGDPTGKGYEITPSIPIVSKILKYAAVYDVAQYNTDKKQVEAGYDVVMASNLDASPEVEYYHLSTQYTAFDGSRLSLETFDTTSYPDRAIIKLKNNSTNAINLTRLRFRGDPVVLAKSYKHSDIDSDTADKTSSTYIGKKELSVNNKYFNDKITYENKQYVDWCSTQLASNKNPKRKYRVDTIRPVIHYRVGSLIKIQETLSGTDIDVKCRLFAIKGTFKKGKANFTLELKEAVLGLGSAGIPTAPQLYSEQGAPAYAASAQAVADEAFVSYEDHQSGYVDTFSGGTTSPAQVTNLLAFSGNREIGLFWDDQPELTNFLGYRIQVTDQASPAEDDWYALGMDGSDWKSGAAEGYTECVDNSFLHTNVPHVGMIPGPPTSRTLYYRVWVVTKTSQEGTKSATATASTQPLVAGDLSADSVGSDQIQDGAVIAAAIADDSLGAVHVDVATWVQPAPIVNCMASWSFDETHGVDVFDNSGNDLAGTITSTDADAMRANGISGKCLNFNGSNEYVSMGNVLGFDYDDPMTISLWFKGTGHSASFVSKQNYNSPWKGYSLGITSGTSIVFEMVSVAASSHLQIYTQSTGWNDGEWHHVVATYDGVDASGVKIYIDGEEETLTTTFDNLSGSITTSVNVLIAGRETTAQYSGMIDEVRIYDSALTLPFVRELYFRPYSPFGQMAVEHTMAPDSVTEQILSSIAGNEAVTAATINVQEYLQLNNEDLEAYWSFDNGEGNTLSEHTPNEYDGNIISTDADAMWENGRVGTCLNFNGSDETVNCGDVDITTNAITISAWIKTSTTGTTQVIVRKENSYILKVTSSNVIQFYVYDSTWYNVYGTVNVCDGEWHHVVGISDGSNAWIYVDGVADVDGVTFAYNIDTNDNNLYIGSAYDSVQYFNGRIDEVRIYSRAIDQAEVKYLYVNPAGLYIGMIDASRIRANVLEAQVAYFNKYISIGEDGFLGANYDLTDPSYEWDGTEQRCFLDEDEITFQKSETVYPTAMSWQDIIKIGGVDKKIALYEGHLQVYDGNIYAYYGNIIGNHIQCTTAGSGWYRVAYMDTGGSGRGCQTVTVYTTGGAHTPSYVTIRWFKNWSNSGSINILDASNGGYWSSARITFNDASTSYLELYFSTAMSYVYVSIRDQGGHFNGRYYDGALTAGGGTVICTADLGNFMNIGNTDVYSNGVRVQQNGVTNMWTDYAGTNEKLNVSDAVCAIWPNDSYYGLFSVRRSDGQRGAYFGYGNGGTNVSLYLDAADYLYVTSDANDAHLVVNDSSSFGSVIQAKQAIDTDFGGITTKGLSGTYSYALSVRDGWSGNYIIRSDPTTHYWTFTQTGNFLIGMSSQQGNADLHIYSATPRIRLSDSDASTDTEVAAYFEFYRGVNTSRIGWIGWGSQVDEHLILYNQTVDGNIMFYTDSSERMTIHDTGEFDFGNVVARHGYFHFYDDAELGGTTGNYEKLFTISGDCGTSNTAFRTLFAYRDATGTNWNTYRFHDGISIDSSYWIPHGTSSTGTRVWMDRDPYGAIFEWGDRDVTWMQLQSGNLFRLGTTYRGSDGLFTYHDLLHVEDGSNPRTGTLKIMMPVSWTNTMMRIKISGYCYSGTQGAWEVVVAGYNYQPTPLWGNTSARVTGAAPFDEVRLAHDGTYCCILLGTTSTQWYYPKVSVVEMVCGHQGESSFGAGWNYAWLTSESGISYISSPPLYNYAYERFYIGGRTSGIYMVPQETTGFGAWYLYGTPSSGWQGINLAGRAVFMHDGSNSTRIYDDVNNNNMIICTHGGSVTLHYDNAQKIEAISEGCGVSGTLYAYESSNWIRLDPYYASNYATIRSSGTLYVRAGDAAYTHYFATPGIVGCREIKEYGVSNDYIKITGSSGYSIYVGCDSSFGTFENATTAYTFDKEIRITGYSGTRTLISAAYGSDVDCYIYFYTDTAIWYDANQGVKIMDNGADRLRVSGDNILWGPAARAAYADVYLYYAYDGFWWWDESKDYLYMNKSFRLNSATQQNGRVVYTSTGRTRAEFWTLLNGYFKADGEYVFFSGGGRVKFDGYASVENCIISHGYRNSSTRFTLYGYGMSNSNYGSVVCDSSYTTGGDYFGKMSLCVI